jgi:hypothetical protein
MRILILGALGAYPERIQTFLDHGHSIYFVSTQQIPELELHGDFQLFTYTSLGQNIFGRNQKIAELIDQQKIDLMYSLLNIWDGSLTATAAFLASGPTVPVVRHYKEQYMRPFWEEQITLEQSSAAIFISEESRAYFQQLYTIPESTLCLDGDSIPEKYLTNHFQPKLSSSDGQPHFLIAGTASADNGRYDYRNMIREITQLGAHVHLYAQFRSLKSNGELHSAKEVEEEYQKTLQSSLFHLHAPITPSRFVEEWSRYDAGILHAVKEDDPFRVLNLPNRYTGYLAAGLPITIMADEMPAMYRFLNNLGIALPYNSTQDLLDQFPWRDQNKNAHLSRNKITFEANYPKLIDFFQHVEESL